MTIEELQREMVARLNKALPKLKTLPAGDLSVELIVLALAPWAPSQWHGLIAAAVLKQLAIEQALDPVEETLG